MKITKRNKIGSNKSSDAGKGIKYFNKLNTELNEREKYERQKYNSIMRKNKLSEIQVEDNYLFNENEEKIMEKVLPEEMLNSYRNKYNELFLQKKEAEDKLKTDSNTIRRENETINNKCEYNKLVILTKLYIII